MVWKSKPEPSAVARQSSRSGQTMRCTERALAAAVAVTAMAMTVSMPMDPMRCDAEAAVGGAAIGPAVGAGHGRQAGSAIAAWHQPHRHRAGGGTPHHGQDDAARAFHGAVPFW